MSGMTKVYQLNRLRKSVPGDLGLEIEVEPVSGRALPYVENEIWLTKDEGSLRNGGREYVTNGALSINSKYKSNILSLTDQLQGDNVNKTSNRTSVHVHVNVSNLSIVQVYTAIVSYWLLENLLYKYCGKDRESNLFCLRLKDAEGVIKTVNNSLDYMTPFSDYSDNIRYGGLNLSALYKFGSLEFRGMRGTVNPDEIYEWSTTLYDLVHLSVKEFSSPQAVLDYYYNNSWVSLVRKLVHNKLLRAYMICQLNANELVEENAYRLIGIAYKHNWENYQKIIDKQYSTKPKSKKKLNPEWIIVNDPLNSMPLNNFNEWN